MRFSRTSGLTPKGEIIPDGFHWDGHRLVRNYTGSRRPPGIDSKLWQMLGSNERKKIIEEEDAKSDRKGTRRGQVCSIIERKGSKEKKSTVAQLEATPSPPAKTILVGDRWETIPHAAPKFSVPAMPKVTAPATEMHRPALRELVKEKIREIEFKVAIELFTSVARLVSKEEVARNAKAKKPLLTKNGTISGTRVFGMKSVSVNVVTCRDIVAEARRSNKTVSSLGTHLRSMLRKRIRTCRSQTRDASLKAGQCFRETTFVMRTLTMHSAMS